MRTRTIETYEIAVKANLNPSGDTVLTVRKDFLIRATNSQNACNAALRKMRKEYPDWIAIEIVPFWS